MLHILYPNIYLSYRKERLFFISQIKNKFIRYKIAIRLFLLKTLLN